MRVIRMPALASKYESTVPPGPAPTITTCLPSLNAFPLPLISTLAVISKLLIAATDC